MGRTTRKYRTCGWCGRTNILADGDQLRAHVVKNTDKLCQGSSQPLKNHKFLLKSHAEARKLAKAIKQRQ